MSEAPKKSSLKARLLDSKTVRTIAPGVFIHWLETSQAYEGVGYKAGQKPPDSGVALVQSPYSDWYNLTWGLAPNQDMPKWRWMFRARPEIRRGIDVKTILAVGRGMTIQCDEDEDVEEDANRLLNHMNMRQMLQEAVSDMLVYGTAYMEKVRARPGEVQENENIEMQPVETRMQANAPRLSHNWTNNDLDGIDETQILDGTARSEKINTWKSTLKNYANDVTLIENWLSDPDTRDAIGEYTAAKSKTYNRMLLNSARLITRRRMTAAGIGLSDAQDKPGYADQREDDSLFETAPGELIELKPLDPLWMRVCRDAFGNVIGWVQWGLTPIPQAILNEKLVVFRWMPKSWAQENAYGCIAEDSFVHTNRGLIRIQDVNEGDFVQSYSDGNLSLEKVAKKFAYGKQKLFRFETQHRTIEVTDNHPLLVQTGFKYRGFTRAKGETKLEWKEARDIEEGDYVIVSKNLEDFGKPYKLTAPKSETRNHWQLKEIKYPEYSTPEFCRLFGFMLGDGWMHNNAVAFALGEYRDQNLAYEKSFIDLFDARGNEISGQTQFQIHSQLLRSFFELNGWVNGVHNKAVPSWVYNIPREQRIAFIEGFVDADGWETRHSRGPNGWHIEIANKQLLEGIKALIDSVGWRSNPIHHRSAREAEINGRKLGTNSEGFYYMTFFKRALGNIKPSKKKDYGIIFETENFVGERVKSKIDLGEKNVYDLNIPSTSNFIANGIVAHNTSVLMPVQRHVSFIVQAEEDMKVFWHQYAKPMLVAYGGTTEKPYPNAALSNIAKQLFNRGPTTDVVMPGDTKVEMMQSGAGKGTSQTFSLYAKYLREKIYETLGVPSILMNLPGDTSRGTSDVMLQAFIAEEEMIQEYVGEQVLSQILEPEIRRHFMEKFPDGNIPMMKAVFAPVLEEDRNKKFDRIVKGVGMVPFMAVNEARAQVGLAPMQGPAEDPDKYDRIPEAPAPTTTLSGNASPEANDAISNEMAPSRNPEESESQRTGFGEELKQKQNRSASIESGKNRNKRVKLTR